MEVSDILQIISFLLSLNILPVIIGFLNRARTLVKKGIVLTSQTIKEKMYSGPIRKIASPNISLIYPFLYDSSTNLDHSRVEVAAAGVLLLSLRVSERKEEISWSQ